MFVFSPSNMMAFRTCPRRFQAQSITKEIKWKASVQKSRGTIVHGDIEKAFCKGMQSVTHWDDKLDTSYVSNLIDTVRGIKGQLLIEKELVVTDKFKPTNDWWDGHALLRAKADMLILPDDGDPWLIDLKTGKKWDTEDFQLRVEALLVHLIYGRDVIRYSYEYVDIGERVEGVVDMSRGLLPVQDVVDTMRDMKAAIRDNCFLPVRNRFCRFCDFNGKTECGLME